MQPTEANKPDLLAHSSRVVSVPEKQKPEGSHVANLHIICISMFSAYWSPQCMKVIAQLKDDK